MEREDVIALIWRIFIAFYFSGWDSYTPGTIGMNDSYVE
jgi:hypothetical protein